MFLQVDSPHFYLRVLGLNYLLLGHSYIWEILIEWLIFIRIFRKGHHNVPRMVGIHLKIKIRQSQETKDHLNSYILDLLKFLVPYSWGSLLLWMFCLIRNFLDFCMSPYRLLLNIHQTEPLHSQALSLYKLYYFGAEFIRYATKLQYRT